MVVFVTSAKAMMTKPGSGSRLVQAPLYSNYSQLQKRISFNKILCQEGCLLL